MSETEEGQSLDDFFAKKSKSKKSKNKSKAFTTSKDIADKKQKKKDKTEEATETAPKEVSEAEEQWKDFDAPQETDYSGLRVQALQINDENEKEEEGTSYENFSDGESESKKEQSSGPWAKSSQTQGSTQTSSSEPENVPKSAQKYFPGAYKERVKKERFGVPPDISSQAAFPSLSTSATEPSSSRSDFEVVKRGMKSSGTCQESKPMLSTENRYDSLKS
ncbi:protein CDV3 homolog [Rhopilema esculentum]|uniref:protein CDV3 homolog n=1 Tax=Rhopilema esculentum TaxID=499914 RepID=UPI0031DEC05E